MHTLAPPALPVNPARAIAGGLCLVCTTLAPLPSHAFTYDVLAGSVIIQHQSTGTPLVWPACSYKCRCRDKRTRQGLMAHQERPISAFRW